MAAASGTQVGEPSYAPAEPSTRQTKESLIPTSTIFFANIITFIKPESRRGNPAVFVYAQAGQRKLSADADARPRSE